MKICIPSSNRPNSITSNFIKSAFVFVPEEQYNDYASRIDNIVIPVPNNFYGITKTRNFILDYFKDDDEILFLDDDVKECGFFEKGKRIDLKKTEYSEEWEKQFKRCFEITKQLNLEIFGVESGGSLFANHIFKPISFKGSINGSVLGIVNNGQRFDENYQVKEDYEFILRNYVKNGAFLKFNFFYWRTKHWANKGGCVDYRTNKIEYECINKLKIKYDKYLKLGKNKNMFHLSLKF